MQREKFIDYARGFSILTIVVFHFAGTLSLPKVLTYAITFGGAGVHLFFFVSGFGLVKSKYTTFTNFLKRRVNKVLVPYYITITLIFIVNFFTGFYANNFPAYLSHIFLYKMFVPKYDTSFGEQYWFISTIIQFYLVFPLLLWISNIEKYKTFFIVALFISLTYSLIVSLSPYANERVFNGAFIQYLWEFVLGMIIGKTNSLGKMINKPIIYYFIIAGVCIPLTALFVIKGGWLGKNFNDVFSFSAYTSIVVILFRLLKPLNKFVLWVSGFSYALYLIHMFIFSFTTKLLNAHYINIYVVFLIFLITIGISYLYNFLLNKIDELISAKVLNTNRVP